MTSTDLLSATTLLPVTVVAERLACSKPHVYRLIAAGEIEAVDIATPGSSMSKTRVRESDLLDYINRVTMT